jgi:hypothetical protein
MWAGVSQEVHRMKLRGFQTWNNHAVNRVLPEAYVDDAYQ